MRLSLVSTTIFVFVLLLLVSDPGSSQVGGSTLTDTRLSIPTSLSDGDSVTVTSTTTFSGNPVFLGRTTFYHLDDIRVKGGTDIGTTLTATDPTLEFSVSSDMILRSVRIPFVSISDNAILNWNLTDSSNTLLADGEFGIGTLADMLIDKNLMIVIGSIQSDDTNNENKYASGILLTSGNYKLTIDQVPGLSITTLASSTYQGVKAYQSDIVQSTYPQIYLMGGSHRERVSTINGVASSTFDVFTGTSYVLAYYGDESANFGSSYDFQQIAVASSTPLTVTMDDYETNQGYSVTLKALVLSGGSPVSGATVTFSVNRNNIMIEIGSVTSNPVGIGQYSYIPNLEHGIYGLTAEAAFSTQYGLSTSLLTITQPVATWTNLQQLANYGDVGFGITSTTISGKLLTAGGSPITGATISIYGDGDILGTNSTDSNGDFMYTHLVNQAVGTYVDFYELNITDSFWDPTVVTANLIVSKGILNVDTNNIVVEYIDQPVNIVGTISNTATEPIVSTLYLEYEISPSIWTTLDTISSDSFDFEVQTHSAGSYNYRIRVDESSNWMSKIQPITISVGQSNAVITRASLPSNFEIQYHETSDLSVYVLREDLSAIENADVKVWVFHPTLETDTVIAQGYSDVNGLTILSWLPDDNFMQLPGLPHQMTYTATHNDFVITQLEVSYTLIETDLSLSLVETTWKYDTSSTIVFDSVDSFGFKVNEGTQFNVIIEGISYGMPINSTGHGILQHTFSNVGVASMSVSLNTAFPYNPYSQLLTYTIIKGDYQISATNQQVARGETHIFTASIFDHNGDPLTNPATVSIWLYDVTWIKLGEVTSTTNFEIPVSILLNQGTFSIDWRVAATSLYNDASQNYILTVDKSVSHIASIQIPTSYNFNDISLNREVTLHMKVPVLNENIIDQFVSIDFVSADDSYSWFVQTDSNGDVRITLPQQPITGVYTLTASFIGSTEFLATSSDFTIPVIGIDTTLTWKSIPLDGYYAENQIISVHAEDILGNNLVGFSMDLSIGSDTFSVLTNSTGDASFTVTMNYVGNVEITITLQAKDGWNDQTIQSNISIQKKQLIINSEINSVEYSPTNTNQDIDFAILINSEQDSSIANIKLELQWLNPATSSFEFVDIYYTDSNGYVYLTLSFPTINAAQSYFFRWIATDTDFLSAQLDRDYAVVPMTLTIDITYTSGKFMQSSLIDVTIRNSKGTLISSLEVYMSYTETVLLWSDTTTSSFGTAQIQFISPSVGDLSIYYLVSDPADNYINSEGTFVISIGITDTSTEYSFVDNQGTVNLVVDIRDQSNTVVSEGTVIVERWQGIWQVEKTFSLAQTNSMTVNIYAPDMLFRIRYLENSHYMGSEITAPLSTQDITVINNPFEMQVNDGLPVYLELQGNTTLGGYLVEIFIYDYISQDWINYANLYSTDGIINQSIPVNLGIGTYQIRIAISQQGWYNAFDQIYNLEINFNHFFFETDTTEFIRGQSNSLEVRINTTAPDAVTNVKLDLYIIVDGNNVLIGTAFTDIDGVALFNFTPYQIYGQYEFIIQSTQTALIEASSYTFEGLVGYVTNMELVMNGPAISFIEHGLGGYLTLQLTDQTGNPIYNKSLRMDWYTSESSESSNLPIFVGIYYTNETGYISVYVTPLLINGNTAIFNFALLDEYVVGETDFSFEVDIEPGIPIITYEVTDFGVSINATISVVVLNAINNSIGGEISWQMKSAAQITLVSGSGELELVDGIYQFSFSIDAIYIGDYLLIIDYHDNSILPQYLDGSIYFNHGWSKATAHIDFLSPILSYNQTELVGFTIVDAVGQHPLSNIPVVLAIDGSLFTGMSDEYGMVNFEISIIPGTYEIEFRISDVLLVENDIFQFDFIINKGRVVITGVQPSGYPDIPTQLEMNISDPLSDDELLDHYEVRVYRDGEEVGDVAWIISEDGNIQIYPQYTQSHTLSTANNHQNYLYPGSYQLEIVRYHPYYEDQSYSFNFVIEPSHVDFILEFETIYAVDYLKILYENSSIIDIEFTVTLHNLLLDEKRFYDTVDLIQIPWTQGSMTILVEGRGYTGGRNTGDYEMKTTSAIPTNSTTQGEGYGIDNLININSVQTIGGIAIAGTLSAPFVLKRLKKRKK